MAAASRRPVRVVSAPLLTQSHARLIPLKTGKGQRMWMATAHPRIMAAHDGTDAVPSPASSATAPIICRLTPSSAECIAAISSNSAPGGSTRGGRRVSRRGKHRRRVLMLRSTGGVFAYRMWRVGANETRLPRGPVASPRPWTPPTHVYLQPPTEWSAQLRLAAPAPEPMGSE